MVDASNKLSCFLLEMFCSSFFDYLRGCLPIVTPILESQSLICNVFTYNVIKTKKISKAYVVSLQYFFFMLTFKQSNTYTPKRIVPNNIHRFEQVSIIMNFP